MSRKRTLPVTFIAILLVIALATMGVAYGLWSKTLYIKGTVNTGNVDAELSIESVWDVESKDVGTCEAALGSTYQTNDTLNITVGNGYPSYYCYVKFDVHSTGSIPIHIHQPVLDVPSQLTVALQDCYAQDTQLHFSEKAFCTLSIHVEQEAAQNSSYGFSGTVFVHQFNEEPSP
jgi:hypothetical protein